VIDNGSTDGTVEWLRTQNVTLIENGQNLGYPYAHNTIYDYAWGYGDDTLLILLSNDMLPLPNAFDALIKASDGSDASIISGDTVASPVYCARYPEDRRFFAGGDTIAVGAKGYTSWSSGPHYNLIEETAKEFADIAISKLTTSLHVDELVKVDSFFPPGHRLYRKSYFDAVGYLDANFYPVYSADLDYSMRASLVGQNVYVALSSVCLEFWSRCLYENIVKVKDIRRDDYYREKWGLQAVGFAGPEYSGWRVPFNGNPPSKFDGYDTSQVKISSREGEIERIKQQMVSNIIGRVDLSISKSMDNKNV